MPLEWRNLRQIENGGIPVGKPFTAKELYSRNAAKVFRVLPSKRMALRILSDVPAKRRQLAIGFHYPVMPLGVEDGWWRRRATTQNPRLFLASRFKGICLIFASRYKGALPLSRLAFASRYQGVGLARRRVCAAQPPSKEKPAL